MQVASILSDTDLSLKPYLFGKLLQGIFASLYTFLLIKFTNFFSWDVIESFSYNNTNLPLVKESSNLIGVLLIILAISLSLQIIKKLTQI